MLTVSCRYGPTAMWMHQSFVSIHKFWVPDVFSVFLFSTDCCALCSLHASPQFPTLAGLYSHQCSNPVILTPLHCPCGTPHVYEMHCALSQLNCNLHYTYTFSGFGLADQAEGHNKIQSSDVNQSVTFRLLHRLEPNGRSFSWYDFAGDCTV